MSGVLHAAVFAYSQALAIFAQLLQAVLFGLAPFQVPRRGLVHGGKRAMAPGVFLTLVVAMLFRLCKERAWKRYGSYDRHKASCLLHVNAESAAFFLQSKQ